MQNDTVYTDIITSFIEHPLYKGILNDVQTHDLETTIKEITILQSVCASNLLSVEGDKARLKYLQELATGLYKYYTDNATDYQVDEQSYIISISIIEADNNINTTTAFTRFIALWEADAYPYSLVRKCFDHALNKQVFMLTLHCDNKNIYATGSLGLSVDLERHLSFKSVKESSIFYIDKYTGNTYFKIKYY